VGRASLLRTLDSLAICWEKNCKQFEVIICDDSAERRTLFLISDTARWPFSITITYTASRDIGVARNACLSFCANDFIAFIDDDEVASESWLSDYLLKAKDASADVIFGAVNAIYPINAPLWICAAKPFFKNPGSEGKTIFTGTTANVFIRRKCLIQSGIKFPENIGKYGGEDTIFFENLSRNGCCFIATESAVTYESVPIERMSIKHLFRRYMRGGHTYASIYICQKSTLIKFVLCIYTLFKVAIFLSIFIIFLAFYRSKSLKFMFRGAANLGKLTCIFGIPALRMY
jgi:succinoglycan biosynthesis protein ExoM